MVLLNSPRCESGSAAPGFSLTDTEGRTWTLADARGPNGLLVMFLCNHCPYVKRDLQTMVDAAHLLKAEKVGVVAIMSNDPTGYPEDSFENMQVVARKFEFPFPYLFDETQEVAKAYGAVCTPDFFGYDAGLELQFRGNISQLLDAMVTVARTGRGPAHQSPSIGCSIKWRDAAS